MTNENNWLYIPEINKDVEVLVNDKGKSFNELKEIYRDFEDKLLTKEEVETIQKLPEVSKILKMDGSSYDDDFYIKQYNEECRERGLVAVFYADSDWSGLYCYRDYCWRYSSCGVRFCREHIEGTPQINRKVEIIETPSYSDKSSNSTEFIIQEIKLNGRTYMLVEE